MQRVIVGYKLQPGVTIGQYSAWSLSTDQPVAGVQPGILGFEPNAVDKEASPDSAWDVFEVVTVDAYASFQAMLKADAMEPVNATIAQYVDFSTLTLVAGTPIVAG